MSPRLAPVLFGFILSALMSLLVSAIATLRNFGVDEGFSACGWPPGSPPG